MSCWEENSTSSSKFHCLTWHFCHKLQETLNHNSKEVRRGIILITLSIIFEPNLLCATKEDNVLVLSERMLIHLDGII